MSAFEADCFNRSRTSPEGRYQPPAKTEIPRVARNDKGFLELTANDQRLTTAFKESLQQYAAADFYFVVQVRVIQHLHYRVYGARFGIVRAIDEALDPGVQQGTGAHGARFNCSKQVALRQ